MHDDMDSLKSLCFLHDEYEDSVADSEKIGTSTLSTTGKSTHSSRLKPRRYDQPANNHSNSSVLTTMEKFVQTVDEMNETILVPCRLIDVKFDQPSMNGLDHFQFYTVLNSIKNDLMWGNKDNKKKEQVKVEVKGHVRRPSTVSNGSSASVSDTELYELNEDSGVEVEEEYSQQMADNFKYHLNGLQKCLGELTLVAGDITERYTNDVCGA